MQLIQGVHLMLLATVPVVGAQRYADNQRPILRDGPLVAAAFPSVDVELLTPAFLNPETVPAGFADNAAGPTDQATLERFLQGLAERRSWITYHDDPSLRSEEGRSLPYVKLSTNHLGRSNSTEKLRVYLQGGVHGDEPAGDQAILALLGKLAFNETWALSVLSKLDLLVLPRYSPDSVAYFQRQLATGFDPNRDHALLQRKQTRDLKKLINDFNPHIALDAHEYTGVNPVGANQNYIRAQDVLVSAVKNPNIHAEIRGLGEGLFIETIFDRVKAAGFRTAPYFVTGGSGDDIRLTEPSSISQAGHNSWGLGQTLTFLTETRGIRLGDQHFHRRVAAGLTAAEAIIQIAADNADLVYRTIEGARLSFIEASNDIIVVDRARVTDTAIEFIDKTSGSIIDVPVKFNNNTPSEIVLTRPRPEAYIFSPGFADVAERLRVLGVEVEVLAEPWTGTVETLTVETVTLAASRHEGVVHAAVTTTPGSREVTLPSGAFRVSSRQQNAAFAFVALEPENISSFVTYNVIPLERGEEYPVFRVL
ncbi:carboxypeptidase 2 [Plectosphaerella plurivora]|uniref:Carboxypeptidase 2 n=1 Tax=Plectosphaerella plurivora TaxID=936078 RepID=A0A9P8V0Q4_9PEZI|nr:carboxypeptidase 2 [Plectosphaerella plurivora]